MKMKGTFSCLTMAATVLLIASANYRANAAVTCESLASLPLADATITFAKSIPAGTFARPRRRSVYRPTRFSARCRALPSRPACRRSNSRCGCQLPAGTGSSKALEMAASRERSFTARWCPPFNVALRPPAPILATVPTEPQLWLQNRQLIIDYSYRGLHEMTTNSKAVISAFYQQSASSLASTAAARPAAKKGCMRHSSIPTTMTASSPAIRLISGPMCMFAEVWVGQATDEPATTLSDATLQIPPQQRVEGV